MNKCTTSPKQEFVGVMCTTHERVCGLRSGVNEQLGTGTQTDLHFGIHM